MSKIFKHTVQLYDGKGIISQKNEFKVEEFDLLGQNEEFICINNTTFTTIRRRLKDKIDTYPSLDHHSISLYVHDNIWGTGITYNRYSYEQCPAAAIRAAIKAHVKKRLGFFLDGLDLSFVKDDKQ